MMMPASCAEEPLRIFISGYPGCGKTTLIKELGRLLQTRKFNIVGFYTEEIREKGKRVGFRITGWDGVSDVFAHVKIHSSIRVGKYGVSIERFERIAIPILKKAVSGSIVVIDEIGKMECASEAFKRILTDIIHSRIHLVATLPIRGSDFIEDLKRRYPNSIFTLSRTNYSQIFDNIVNQLATIRKYSFRIR